MSEENTEMTIREFFELNHFLTVTKYLRFIRECYLLIDIYMYKDKSFKHVCSRVHPPILYPLYHINRCPNIYSEITAEPADIDLFV